MTVRAARSEIRPFQTVLVLVDFTDGRRAALDRALALPLAEDAHVEAIRRARSIEAIRGHTDVIAIGTRGRSGLSRTLIGSVAEDVIANAPCDVPVARLVRFSFSMP